MKVNHLSKIALSFILLINNYYQIHGNVLCPPELEELALKTNCEGIKCLSTLRQRDCPLGSVLEENVSVCKCCPGCVKYEHEYNEDPEKLGKPECIPGLEEVDQYDPLCEERICPIVRQCPRGLVCTLDSTDNKHKCLLPDPLPTCQGRCWIHQAVAKTDGWDWDYANACTSDGYFKPIQCKGEAVSGDCFCTDKCGVRLFGRARLANAESQTCECSLRVHEMRQNGRIATLHCTEEGNFEALQCDTDSDLCYCMDPTTGKLTGDVLPENQWKNLPCYNSSATNFDDDGRYLRRCESEWAAATKIFKEAQLHGLNFDHRSLKLNCDYDGGFGPVFRDVGDNRDFCSHKDGTQIAGYFRILNNIVPMDCRCARDIVYYSINGIDFGRQCETGLSIGSYFPSYVNGINATCVDNDGYAYGTPVPSEDSCCLQSIESSDGSIATTCPNENECMLDGEKIKRCAEYKLVREHVIPKA